MPEPRGDSYEYKATLLCSSTENIAKQNYVLPSILIVACQQVICITTDCTMLFQFHMNQHTGAKPYKCPFCDKSFASSGNCYSHRNRMHPEEKQGVTVRNIVPASPPTLRPIAPKPDPKKSPYHNLTSINGIIKFKCHLCEHSFVKKENFNVSIIFINKHAIKCMVINNNCDFFLEQLPTIVL